MSGPILDIIIKFIKLPIVLSSRPYNKLVVFPIDFFNERQNFDFGIMETNGTHSDITRV